MGVALDVLAEILGQRLDVRIHCMWLSQVDRSENRPGSREVLERESWSGVRAGFDGLPFGYGRAGV